MKDFERPGMGIIISGWGIWEEMLFEFNMEKLLGFWHAEIDSNALKCRQNCDKNCVNC